MKALPVSVKQSKDYDQACSQSVKIKRLYISTVNNNNNTTATQRTTDNNNLHNSTRILRKQIPATVTFRVREQMQALKPDRKQKTRQRQRDREIDRDRDQYIYIHVESVDIIKNR